MKLYHASPIKNLKIIEPQRTLSKDLYIGDFVFATPSKAMAAMYLAPKAAGTILINAFNSEPYAIVNSNPEDFKKVDTGGSIYVVDSELFETSPQVGLEETELVSKLAVKPVAEEYYKTSLEAMQKFSVKLFFAEGKLFEDIMYAEDHGLKILSKLQPYKY